MIFCTSVEHVTYAKKQTLQYTSKPDLYSRYDHFFIHSCACSFVPPIHYL